jgi:hypothetical protein
MKEQQSTTLDDGKISGDFIVKLSEVTIDDFLKFRGQVRNLSERFSGISHSQTIINEKALIMENRLDRHPEEKIILQPAVAIQDSLGGARPQTFPPAVKKYEDTNENKSRVKAPYLGRSIRVFMQESFGQDYGSIISTFRRTFAKSKATDAEIRGFYNRVHGVRE